MSKFSNFQMNQVPYLELQIRTVPKDLRDHSVSWLSVFARLLGSIPGPIAIGYILDNSCLSFEKDTCFTDRDAACSLFDVQKAKWVIFWLCIGSKLVALLCNSVTAFFTWQDYKNGVDYESAVVNAAYEDEDVK